MDSSSFHSPLLCSVVRKFFVKLYLLTTLLNKLKSWKNSARDDLCFDMGSRTLILNKRKNRIPKNKVSTFYWKVCYYISILKNEKCESIHCFISLFWFPVSFKGVLNVILFFLICKNDLCISIIVSSIKIWFQNV